MSIRTQMNKIYSDLAPEQIPWNITEPPALLIELVESEKLTPCKALDLGCGAGNYAVYLAEQGFEVTGVDISEAAIELARQRAQEAKVPCRFVAADIAAALPAIGTDFRFALEWEVLHHVLPHDRPRYLDNIRALLAPGGLYLTACFSEKSPAFGGQGKRRMTPLGTELYFSSEDELRDLFAPRFQILELDTLEVPGKREPHLAIRALLIKP